MLSQPAGRQVLSDQVIPLSELRRSGFYNDVIGPHGLAHSSMTALIARPDVLVGWTICSSPSEGPFDDERRAVIDRLLPHLQRATQLQLRVEQFDALKEAALATLDTLTMGVVILDRWGAVLFANRSALESAGGKAITIRDRTVQPASPSDALSFKRLIHSAISDGAGGSMALAAVVGERLPVLALVAPLRGAIRAQVAGGAMSSAAAAIFLRDPNRRTETDMSAMAGLFGLTAAESRVASALLDGDDLAAVGARLGVSVNTLKTHAKRIYAKTGVSRHAQFVRLVAARSPAVDVREGPLQPQ
jgi:DNA-binding CsgD family transcriptional regulator